MQIHGQNDTTVPYNGGIGVMGIDFLSAKDSVNFWAKFSNCNIVPQKTKKSKDTTSFNYLNCEENVEIKLVSLANTKHRIPSKILNIPKSNFIMHIMYSTNYKVTTNLNSLSIKNLLVLLADFF